MKTKSDAEQRSADATGTPDESSAAGRAERAREKLGNKRADLIVFNDVGRDDIGFDSPENEVVLVSAEGERRIEKAAKERIASAILDDVVARLEGGAWTRR